MKQAWYNALFKGKALYHACFIWIRKKKQEKDILINLWPFNTKFGKEDEQSFDSVVKVRQHSNKN